MYSFSIDNYNYPKWIKPFNTIWSLTLVLAACSFLKIGLPYPIDMLSQAAENLIVILMTPQYFAIVFITMMISLIYILRKHTAWLELEKLFQIDLPSDIRATSMIGTLNGVQFANIFKYSTEEAGLYIHSVMALSYWFRPIFISWDELSLTVKPEEEKQSIFSFQKSPTDYVHIQTKQTSLLNLKLKSDQLDEIFMSKIHAS